MDNTVGSYKNKFWNKKWIKIKDSLHLTPFQRAVLVGSILGDGTLQVGKRGVNANFKVEHGLSQKDYVWWKYKIFRQWVFTEPKISFRYKDDGTRYQKSFWFRTIRHPIIRELHKRFYQNGKKIIPDDIEHELTPLTLAVWIMDDGGYAHSNLNISTYSFSKKEVERLLKSIFIRYKIQGRYHRDRDKGYRTYFNTKETKKLINVIKQYIVPKLRYKIGFL